MDPHVVYDSSNKDSGAVDQQDDEFITMDISAVQTIGDATLLVEVSSLSLTTFTGEPLGGEVGIGGPLYGSRCGG